MQQLNLLTAAAFLLGLVAFAYDAFTPSAATQIASVPAESMGGFGDMPAGLD